MEGGGPPIRKIAADRRLSGRLTSKHALVAVTDQCLQSWSIGGGWFNGKSERRLGGVWLRPHTSDLGYCPGKCAGANIPEAYTADTSYVALDGLQPYPVAYVRAQVADAFGTITFGVMRVSLIPGQAFQ